MGLLYRLLQESGPPPRPCDAITVDDADDRQIVGSLVVWFGGDDQRRVVELIRQGRSIGAITREQLYDVADDLYKGHGLGEADGMGLPGPVSYPPTELRCPHGDYTLTVTVHRRAWHCPNHPGTLLVASGR